MSKIFILSFVPYPVRSGGNVAQVSILEDLQFKMDVTFCAAVFNEEQVRYVEELKKILPKINFVYASNGRRTAKKKSLSQQLITTAKNILVRKAKVAASQPPQDDFYSQTFYQSFDYKGEQFLNEVHALMRKQEYDIVQLEYHPFAELVHLIPEKAKKVFVAHESRLLRLKSGYEKSTASAVYKDFLLSRHELSEINLLKKYDKIFVLSEHDKQAYSSYGLDNTFVTPSPVLSGEFIPQKEYHEPESIVFIGNQGHVPNLNGLLWYLENCHNEVVKKTGMGLVVIGNWVIADEVTSKYSHVTFVGSVEDINPYYEKALLVVPIFLGSGIRMKILFGMAKRVPIVSTELGAQGLDIKDGRELLLADTPSDFIEKIVQAKATSDECSKMVDNAYDFVNAHYRQDKIVDQRIDVYKTL